jgi:hypothetical protein
MHIPARHIALLFAALPSFAWAQTFTRVGDATAFILSESSRPFWAQELSVANSDPGTEILLKSRSLKDGHFNYLYRVRADALDVGGMQWLPDGTVMVPCKGEARCVRASQASTGQKILDFGYLTFGPFPAEPERRSRDEQAVRKLIELARTAR